MYVVCVCEGGESVCVNVCVNKDIDISMTKVS